MTFFETAQILAVIFPVLLTLYLQWVNNAFQAELTEKMVKFPIAHQAHYTALECTNQLFEMMDMRTDFDMGRHFFKYIHVGLKTMIAMETLQPNDDTIKKIHETNLIELGELINEYKDAKYPDMLKVQSGFMDAIKKMIQAIGAQMQRESLSKFY